MPVIDNTIMINMILVRIHAWYQVSWLWVYWLASLDIEVKCHCILVWYILLGMADPFEIIYTTCQWKYIYNHRRVSLVGCVKQLWIRSVRSNSSILPIKKLCDMACFSGPTWPSRKGTWRWHHGNPESYQTPHHWQLMMSSSATRMWCQHRVMFNFRLEQ